MTNLIGKGTSFNVDILAQALADGYSVKAAAEMATENTVDQNDPVADAASFYGNVAQQCMDLDAEIKTDTDESDLIKAQDRLETEIATNCNEADAAIEHRIAQLVENEAEGEAFTTRFNQISGDTPTDLREMTRRDFVGYDADDARDRAEVAHAEGYDDTHGDYGPDISTTEMIKDDANDGDAPSNEVHPGLTDAQFTEIKRLQAQGKIDYFIRDDLELDEDELQQSIDAEDEWMAAAEAQDVQEEEESMKEIRTESYINKLNSHLDDARECIADLLGMLDDALGVEMHSYGYTPSWYVEAAAIACGVELPSTPDIGGMLNKDGAAEFAEVQRDKATEADRLELQDMPHSWQPGYDDRG